MTAAHPIAEQVPGQLPGSASSLRQRKKDATFQAISDAAWELFAERGYDDTSINDIAERANVAPRTFFRYFPTKEAVLYPEFDEKLVVVREAFAARPADEPLLVSLIASLDTLASSMTESSDRNQARYLVMKATANASIGDYFRRRMLDTVAEMVCAREANNSECQLRARLASGMISLIFDTAREHWMNTGSGEPLHDVGQRCMTLLHDLITAPPSRAE